VRNPLINSASFCSYCSLKQGSFLDRPSPS